MLENDVLATVRFFSKDKKKLFCSFMEQDLGYFLFVFSLGSTTEINSWWCGPIQLKRFKSHLHQKGWPWPPDTSVLHTRTAFLLREGVCVGPHNKLREGPKWLKTMHFFGMIIFQTWRAARGGKLADQVGSSADCRGLGGHA